MPPQDRCPIGSLAAERTIPRINSEGTSGPRPWDFTTGSVESRAAARMHLVRWFNSQKRITIVFNIPRRGTDPSRVSFGNWQEWQNGTLGRLAYVPHVWLKPGDPIPTRSDCGTPFEKTGDYATMVGFQADCLDKHDPELNGQSKNARPCNE